MLHRALLLALVAALLGANVHPQSPPGGGDQDAALTARLVGLAADADRDGQVSGPEWTVFVDGLAADATEPLDNGLVKARLALALLDRDRDGSVTRADLEAVLGVWDADGDGAVGEAELASAQSAPPGGEAGAPPGLGPDRALVEETVVRAADADGSGGVDADEWRALVAAALPAPDSRLAAESVAPWIARAEAIPPADRNAFTPGVYFLTLDSELDVDQNGRLTAGDLQRLLQALDADGSGAVEAREFRPPPQTGPGGPGGPAFGWRRPDDEQRRKPPLIPWQRNLDDALALVAATGKPLLIAVNMDGETASESLAWFRYRDPGFAELVHGFVPLIVSPDRRNRRDHDDRGRRIPDPRFGRVVTSEHLDLDATLYDRYFGERAVAPRHIGVAPDGTILFDIFLVNDPGIVDRALREHGVPGPLPGEGEVLGEEALLESPDATHREQLETRFLQAGEAARLRLAGRALDPARRAQHPELVRLALRDDARGVRLAAARAAGRMPSALPRELILEALHVAHGEPGELAVLVDALHRAAAAAAGSGDPLGLRSLVRVHAGLLLDSRLLDVRRWGLALARAPEAREEALDAGQLEALLEEFDELQRLRRETPDDRELNALLAAAALRCARVQILRSENPSFFLEDARAYARSAGAPGRPHAGALATLAWASYLLSDFPGTVEAAAAALPLLQGEAGSPAAAQTLRVFAQARTRSLYDAMRAGEEWPPSWIPDLVAAHAVLAAHPAATAQDAVARLELLGAIEAHGPQAGAAREALARFPSAGDLHAYMRGQVLRDRGADALEAAYRELSAPPGEAAALEWYAGLATLFAAERHVQNRDFDAALGAYARSVALFRSSFAMEPGYAASAQHYVCLALAGRARLLADEGRLDEARAALEEGLAARPESATAEDGLGNTALQIARYLHSLLRKANRRDDAEALQEFLDDRGLQME